MIYSKLIKLNYNNIDQINVKVNKMTCHFIEGTITLKSRETSFNHASCQCYRSVTIVDKTNVYQYIVHNMTFVLNDNILSIKCIPEVIL